MSDNKYYVKSAKSGLSYFPYCYSNIGIAPRSYVWHHTVVPPLSPTEQRIIGLCSKIAATPDSGDLEPTVKELKDAIHQHLAAAREKVAEFAVAVAAIDESKAA